MAETDSPPPASELSNTELYREYEMRKDNVTTPRVEELQEEIASRWQAKIESELQPEELKVTEEKITEYKQRI